MSGILLNVLTAILHPIAARAGDVLAWHPARCIRVLRADGRQCRIVRELPLDNARALAALLADDIIAPCDGEDAVRLSREHLPASHAPVRTVKAPPVVRSAAAQRRRLSIVL